MHCREARCGGLPELTDHGDFFCAAPVELAVALPPKLDLRPPCGLVYDQVQRGGCVVIANASAIEFERLKLETVICHR